jgi:hypothetical protein
VCGVGELLRSGRVVDWDAVAGVAARLGATHRLSAGIELAVRLLDAPPPPPTIGRLIAPAERAAAAVIARLFARPLDVATSWECLSFLAATDPDLATRLARYRRTIFAAHPADAAALRLPTALRPLYSIVRPMRLALRAGRRALRGPRPSGGG